MKLAFRKHGLTPSRRDLARPDRLRSLRGIAALGGALFVVCALTIACGGDGAPVPEADSPAGEAPATTGVDDRPLFTEISAEAGLDFVHDRGTTGEWHMMETMGSGVALIDYDNDGWLDAYMLDGGPMPGFSDGEIRPNRLFRNRGDGTFEDVTEGSGLDDPGYSQGVCYGDIDNDGDGDVYLANFGPNALYRNRGDGTFEAITETAGVGDDRWGASCGFADYDGDGLLDLYLVNYVVYTQENLRTCGDRDNPTYCPPEVYPGDSDVLFRNLGGGRFEDATAKAGILIDDPDQGPGLGIVWADLDNDGDLDIYVTNDMTANFLFRNRGDGTFEDLGLVAGAAFNEQGRPEAGMGVDVGDIDNDGWLDLLMAHNSFETNTLYYNLGGQLFEDRTTMTGIAGPSFQWVGFGINFIDFDNDGDLDIFVANGHIMDNIAHYKPSEVYEQADQLLENDGSGRFTDISPRIGPYFEDHRVGRGTARGDIDNDGDIDLLVSNNNQRAVLLRNEGVAGGNWLGLHLLSRHGGRDAIGARATLEAGGATWLREVTGANSYYSQGDPRLHFGLGDRTAIDRLTIRWPDGTEEEIDPARVPLNRWTRLQEPAESEG
jgi:hypothetical protein